MITINGAIDTPNCNEIQAKIRTWINTNSLSPNSNYIWKIGVTCGDSLAHVQCLIVNDLECVHWKSWTIDSFHQAVKTIGELHKSPIIFKSEFCNYRSCGTFIFIYKTRLVQQDLFHLSRGYYRKLSVAS